MARAPRLSETEAWAREQRALAGALGLTIGEWVAELHAAGERTAGLTAAVIGAATSRGAKLSILSELEGHELAERAARLIDPAPPSVDHPLLAEAIRRAQDVPIERKGRSLLRPELPTPERPGLDAPSADRSTPDAPGAEDET